MNNKQRKEIIVNAAKWAMNTKHITLIKNDWWNYDRDNDSDKCACPLTCLLLQNNEDVVYWQSDGEEPLEIPQETIDEVANLLHLSDPRWIWDFIAGVDGNTTREVIYRGAYSIGHQISSQLKIIDVDEWAQV